MPAPISKSPEERIFVVETGASMHMLSKRDLSSDELDTLRRSRTPTTVVTANGEVQNNEDAHVYVHDLGLFLTVQLLDDTPTVLSLGKLCKEHGYSYESASGQEPRLTKQGKKKYAERKITYLLSYQVCHPVQEVVRPQHREHRIGRHQIQQHIEVTCQLLETGARQIQKAKNKIKRRMTISIRMPVCKIFLSGWRSSQIIWRTPKSLCPHTFLRTHIRNVLRKRY